VPQIMLNTLVSSTYVVYVSVETKTRLSAARDTSGGKKHPDLSSTSSYLFTIPAMNTKYRN